MEFVSVKKYKFYYTTVVCLTKVMRSLTALPNEIKMVQRGQNMSM